MPANSHSPRARRVAPDHASLATSAPGDRLVCHGCGFSAALDGAPVRCPDAREGDDIDHVLRPALRGPLVAPAGADPNPFIRYRGLLATTRLGVAREGDAALVSRIRALDAAIAAVDGRGFHETPLRAGDAVARALGLELDLQLKDETHAVGGSHKARHLFGLLLHEHLSLGSSSGAPRLAIASCGNAALAAATLAAAAAGWPLDVFVPPDAEPAVLSRLRALAATIHVCPRDPAVPGDPCTRAFEASTRAGARPFTVQGPYNGLCTDGGQTLALELAEQRSRALDPPGDPRRARPLDLLVVQIGGGALACAVYDGLQRARDVGLIAGLPRICAVQPERAHPMIRAYERFVADVIAETPGGAPEEPRARADWLRSPPVWPTTRALLEGVTRQRSRYMWPWQPAGVSLARGILDDETYDWVGVLRAMVDTGGFPLQAGEAGLVAAQDAARAGLGLEVSATGVAGLAGLLDARARGLLRAGERVCALLTGVDRERGAPASNYAAPA
ncbi:MAG: pyridoxal-phosphate dependent enzyme [Myxococcales bacterium]|nr:pyridoxal-phosphate dependent enzyme [Myxococcales bacterium]